MKFLNYARLEKLQIIISNTPKRKQRWTIEVSTLQSREWVDKNLIKLYRQYAIPEKILKPTVYILVSTTLYE